jgi:hypothetical protein
MVELCPCFQLQKVVISFIGECNQILSQDFWESIFYTDIQKLSNQNIVYIGYIALIGVLSSMSTKPY